MCLIRVIEHFPFIFYLRKEMMATDILQALKDSYQEAIEARQKPIIHHLGIAKGQNFSVASVRRYMLYAVDLLNLYLRIKRDREWYDYHDDRW